MLASIACLGLLVVGAASKIDPPPLVPVPDLALSGRCYFDCAHQEAVQPQGNCTAPSAVVQCSFSTKATEKSGTDAYNRPYNGELTWTLDSVPPGFAVEQTGSMQGLYNASDDYTLEGVRFKGALGGLTEGVTSAQFELASKPYSGRASIVGKFDFTREHPDEQGYDAGGFVFFGYSTKI